MTSGSNPFEAQGYHPALMDITTQALKSGQNREDEQDGIKAPAIQEAVLRDSVMIIDCGDIEPIPPARASHRGKMILDFSSGSLEVTITRADSTE